MSTPPGQTISQRQNLQQRLILTQELQLFLKLIQMTTIELREYLEQELIENPVLEEEIQDAGNGEDISLYGDEASFKPDGENHLESRDDDFPFVKEFAEGFEEEIPWENRISSPESLLDHLRWQISLSDLSTESKEIASLIIGNVNEDGYLEAELDEIAAMLAVSRLEPNTETQNLNEEEKNKFYEELVKSDRTYACEIERVLNQIQSSFDPPGVCARNLKECLRIQAEDIGYSKDDVLMKLIENHLEDISKKEYKLVSEGLSISLEEVRAAAFLISSLEPKPGRPFYLKDAEKHIVPDFYVYKVENDLQIQVSRDLPRVRVSNYYRNLIRQERNLTSDVKKYIKGKLEAAQRIIKCLEERDTAVRKVVKHILEFQKDFFDHGKDYIKPLRLKDIAHAVGVHESTVSRITSRRYIQTPCGIVELKSFFSRKIETSHGDDVSFERVKVLIKDIVSGEPPESPYSDEDISKILQRKNVIVARRTVSKYRKILQISSSSERVKRGEKV